MTETNIWGTVGTGSLALAAAVLVFLFVRVGLSPIPARGPRGIARRRARAAGGAIWSLEPLVRLIAAHIAPLPLRKRRAAIDLQITRAGDYLGLSADEFVALSIVSGIVGFGVGCMFGYVMDMGDVAVVFGTALGVMLPGIQLNGVVQGRAKNINRGLPGAIDLASMCMGAGLDFPASLEQVVNNMPGTESPIKQELQRILDELRLGRTRKQALQAFAVRAPTECVRDFVSAAVQAEEKGNPLSEVLVIQASMLRLRRSVMAEEAAAKAGVKMMLPLMMLFACVFLILMGPFIVSMMGGGQ